MTSNNVDYIWKRNEEICDLAKSGEYSVLQLTKIYHLTSDMIYKILRGKEIKIEKKPRFDFDKPLSPLHFQIGQRFATVRIEVVKTILEDMAFLMKTSAKRLSRIEQGLEEITLTDLQRISDISFINIEEFLCKNPSVITNSRT